MKKKHAFTLLEIMIVILLIGLIGSVVGYNMKGSLDEGKAFKSEHAAAQLRDFLLLEMAKGASTDDLVNHTEDCLRNSGLAKDVEALLKDGWGERFVVKPHSKDGIRVTSARLKNYRTKKNTYGKKASDNDDDDKDVLDQIPIQGQS